MFFCKPGWSVKGLKAEDHSQKPREAALCLVKSLSFIYPVLDFGSSPHLCFEIRMEEVDCFFVPIQPGMCMVRCFGEHLNSMTTSNRNHNTGIC